jgi:DNA-binding transcriptional MerR regulator
MRAGQPGACIDKRTCLCYHTTKLQGVSGEGRRMGVMSDSAHATPHRRGLDPIDPSEVLDRLVLGIGQAAAVCGVSVRQLSYWTEKGFIAPVHHHKGRAYDYAALEKTWLIKDGLSQGYTLDGAVAAAEVFLRRRNEERKQVDRLSGPQLDQFLLSQAEHLRHTADRIRREVETSRRANLGELAVSCSGVQGILAMLERNPNVVTTAADLALRLGKAVEEVEKELRLMEDRRLVQRLRYPHGDVYRYVSRRR